MRRATLVNTYHRIFGEGISIHALLAESDSKPRHLKSRRMVFLSTLSLRRATGYQRPYARPTTDFYPRSPCGERQTTTRVLILNPLISIHALLAESDRSLRQLQSALRDFYPRSPCGERLEEVSGDTWQRDFYPRSPCGERRARRASRQQPAGISIHALLAESDHGLGASNHQGRQISIHALLAESDNLHPGCCALIH